MTSTSRSSWIVLTASLLALSASALATEEVEVTDPVLASHGYQLSMGNSFRAAQGSFDPYGDYLGYPGGSSSWSWMTSLGGSYRLSHRWETSLSIAMRHSELDVPSGSQVSTSLGSLTGGARYHLGGWAHLMLHGGVSTPWHMGYRDIQGNPAASMPDDISDGYVPGWSIRTGMGASRSFGRIRIALDGTVTFPFAAMSDQSDGPPGPPESIQSGRRFALSQGASYQLTHSWSVNTGLRQNWGLDTYVNGADIVGTASRGFSTSVGAGYSPSLNWRYMASFDTQYPFYAYAVNQAYAPSLSLTMVYVGL